MDTEINMRGHDDYSPEAIVLLAEHLIVFGGPDAVWRTLQGLMAERAKQHAGGYPAGVATCTDAISLLRHAVTVMVDENAHDGTIVALDSSNVVDILAAMKKAQGGE